MIAILYREELKEYDFGPWHSFRGDRYGIIFGFLRAHLTEEVHYRVLGADGASETDLLKIRRQDYVDFTRAYYRAASEGKAHSPHFGLFHSADNRPLGRPGKIEEAARLAQRARGRRCAWQNHEAPVFSSDWAEAEGLPPLFAESLWVSLLTAKIPAGAFANPAATPAPHPSFRLKKK